MDDMFFEVNVFHSFYFGMGRISPFKTTKINHIENVAFRYLIQIHSLSELALDFRF